MKAIPIQNTTPEMTMPENPPAPPSDAMIAAAPEFVVDGQWDDKEWRDIAARPSSTWTEQEAYIWAGGPRPHPWGHAAFMSARPDGKQVAFPNEAAHDKHMADAKAKTNQGADAAQNTLLALNAGLAAQTGDTAAPQPVQPVLPSDHPDQADAMLEAASPHGTVAH